jgi:N-acetyl-gamma-glutamyl-phosphate reductase
VSKTRVAVLGGTGYTGRELLRLLARHPSVELVAVTSRQHVGVPVGSVHPTLRGVVNLKCESLTAEQLAERAECVFSALPHGVSMEVCGELLKRDCRVIDLSADYRLRDPNSFAEWYGMSHRDPEHLGLAVYGLPELFGREIQEARLVANPGCYAAAAILALAPLVSGELIELSGIVVDAKSGVSGAGRSPQAQFHFPECNENTFAYKPGTHRHTPEMEQVLAQLAGSPVSLLFVPHVVPMDRGIFATTYGRLHGRYSQEDLLELFRSFYAKAPFVRVRDEIPGTKDTVGTNYWDVTVRVVNGRVVVLSALDNLLKGASGTAVQNFNLMYGYPQPCALEP